MASKFDGLISHVLLLFSGTFRLCTGKDLLRAHNLWLEETISICAQARASQSGPSSPNPSDAADTMIARSNYSNWHPKKVHAFALGSQSSRDLVRLTRCDSRKLASKPHRCCRFPFRNMRTCLSASRLLQRQRYRRHDTKSQAGTSSTKMGRLRKFAKSRRVVEDLEKMASKTMANPSTLSPMEVATRAAFHSASALSPDAAYVSNLSLNVTPLVALVGCRRW